MNKICYNKNDTGKIFALTVVVAVLISSLIAAIFTKSQTDTVQFWITQAIYTLAIGAVAPLYAAFTKTKFVEATKINKKPPLDHLLWGMGITVFLIMLMSPLNELILDGIEALGLKRPSTPLENHVSLAPLLIISCVLAAFCEELTFRGTLGGSLAQNPNTTGLVFIGGALFALFHMNPAQTVHQFALGTIMTLLFIRSDSLWTTVAVHFFNNLLAVVLMYVLPADFIANNNIWMMIVGAIGLGVTIPLYLKFTKSRKQTEEQPKTDAFSLVALITAACMCGTVWITSLLG